MLKTNPSNQAKKNFYQIFYTEGPSKRPLCRFDLFTVMYQNVLQQSKYTNAEYTFRGDHFTDDPQKMLQNLIKMIVKNAWKYNVIDLRDNSIPFNNPERYILRIRNGIIQQPHFLLNYIEILQKFPQADIIRALIE